MGLFRIIGPLLLLVLIYWIVQRYSKRKGLTTSQFKWLFGISCVMAALVVMVMLGRIPVQTLLAPLVLIVTFGLRNLPLFLRLFPMFQSWRRSRGSGAAGGGRAGDMSTIRTRYLAMELQHATGEMDGEILQGQFANRRVSDLSLEELLALAVECREDADSIQVLQAYLDRTHADWREQAGAGEGDDERQVQSESVMSEPLALEILGLERGASEETIVAAHRKLMQKMHPDRGGSVYLAQKINAAKDFLLRRKK